MSPTATTTTKTPKSVIVEGHVSNREAAVEFGTDLSQWHLTVEGGKHIWRYRGDDGWQPDRDQNILEKYSLGLSCELPCTTASGEPNEALRKTWDFLKHLQTEGGTWGLNFDGPLFVTSGMVFAMYFTGTEIGRHQKLEMCRYVINVVNEDGGWGTYLEGPSTVFGTTVNYIMLRMLGLAPTHPVCVKARTVLHSLGTALANPTWGKFWLCVLNLCSWEGVVPLIPEPLLAPAAMPINPGNWWMPVRNIYIGMSYIYGHGLTVPENQLIRELRQEIYQLPYGDIDWRRHRADVSESDLLKPRTSLQKFTAFTLGQVQDWHVPFLRRRALKEALFQIEAEVHNTRYLCIAPVPWATHLIALWHAHGPDSHWVRGMLDRFMDPMWMCGEGLAASGTDGTFVWDTALVLSAVATSKMPLQQNDLAYLDRALQFLRDSQIRENPLGLEHVYRHPSKGGWPFSTRDQGYSVSDTTAEAVRAIIHTQKLVSGPRRISDRRLKDAIDYLLGMESLTGGFAAYEKVRGPKYLEYFNLTDSYESCMAESRYPECTASVIAALSDFVDVFPDYRPSDIHQCIRRSVKWLLEAQLSEGGWYGSWGVCYSYATMCALQGLACVNMFEGNSQQVKRACDFLLQHQNPDGGWGEALESAKVKRYIQEPKGSQIPQTAWAVIGLLSARCGNLDAVGRGVYFILGRQQPAGGWLPGTVEGIHVPPGGIRYPLYKFHFTIKALGMWINQRGGVALKS